MTIVNDWFIKCSVLQMTVPVGNFKYEEMQGLERQVKGKKHNKWKKTNETVQTFT